MTPDEARAEAEAVFAASRAPSREGNPLASLIVHERRAAVKEALARLPARQREAIEMRYGLAGQEAMTFRKMGRALGVCAERARQLVCLGERKLYHALSRRREDLA